MKIFNVLLLFLVTIVASICCGEHPDKENLKQALNLKMLIAGENTHNRIFWFKVQDQKDPYTEMHDVVENVIKSFKKKYIEPENKCANIFFDSNQKPPKETWQNFNGWQPRDKNFPQKTNDLNVMIYNIPDINCINQDFVTLLKDNIEYQKTKSLKDKNNCFLIINSTIQHDHKIKKLTRLLGSHIISSGDFQKELILPWKQNIRKSARIISLFIILCITSLTIYNNINAYINPAI